jgi:hypothetical protein
MAVRNITRTKSVLFTCLVFVFFLCCVEGVLRIFLAVQYKSSSFLIYGLNQKPRFNHVQAVDPYINYYLNIAR